MVAGVSQFNENDDDPAPREPASQMIYFNRTDGDPEHRPAPSMMDRTPDIHGHVNYFRKVHVNEKASAGWRMKLGSALKKDLGLDEQKQWYLAGWPEKYELFVQAKGHRDDPRHDLYLFGSSQRFRSANEFYPHARWLLVGKEGEKCECKYCGPLKMQRAVNFREGLGPPVAPSTSQAAPRRPQQSRAESPSSSSGYSTAGPSTASRPRHPRRKASQAKKEDLHYPADPQLVTDLLSKRMFRRGELVWMRLSPTLVFPDASIEWWPAIVVEVRVKTTIGPHTPGEPYNVQKVDVLRVMMLGLAANYVVEDGIVLPWLAHNPPPALMDRVSNAVENLEYKPDLDIFTCFAPQPDPLAIGQALTASDLSAPSAPAPKSACIPASPAAALLAYGLSLSTAWHMGTYWCFSEEYPDPEDPDRKHPPSHPPRYQAMWWGAERIWTGEVVRIKPQRSWLTGDLLEPSPGTDERATFMKVEALSLQPIQGANGEVVHRPIVSGTLYELARETAVSEPTHAPAQGAATSSTTQSSPAKSYTQLTIPLPPAPQGFFFRPITPPDYDAHLDVYMIAGRYYPQLVTAPILATLPDVIPPTPVASSSSSAPPPAFLAKPTYPPHLMALFGLSPGLVAGTEATIVVLGRRQMLSDARKAAVGELEDRMKDLPEAPAPVPSTVDAEMDGEDDGMGTPKASARQLAKMPPDQMAGMAGVNDAGPSRSVTNGKAPAVLPPHEAPKQEMVPPQLNFSPVRSGSGSGRSFEDAIMIDFD